MVVQGTAKVVIGGEERLVRENESVYIVATQWHRLENPGKTPLEVEAGLLANTPPEYLKDAHHWLLLHGRYVCTARAPHCPTCLIRDLCEYKHKTPPPKPRRSGARSS